MKYKLLTLILSVVLLSGCANQTPSAPPSSEPSVPASTESSVETESSIAQPSAETESSEEETQAYILTFEASTIEGDQVTSDIFANSKLTMINIWATYCNPCLNEMPDLGEIAASYDPEIFQMYGIISDVVEGDSSDTIEEAKILINETHADYPHLLLNQSLYSKLVSGMDSVPTTIFVNRQSEILGYLVGAQTKETWVAIIEDLLSQLE
jgi:thiol-disulfide isomerase/thioredoxin